MVRRRRGRRMHYRITLRRNPSKKRRTRRSPAARIIRPRIRFSGGKFFRSKKSRTFSGPTMINPRRYRRRRRMNPLYRRSRRSYRRNPAIMAQLRSSFSRSWLMNSATIGGGIAIGYLGIPLTYKLLTMTKQTQLRPYLGIVHLVLGALISGMGKKAYMRTIGATVAGVGAYDLLSQNVTALDLPRVSESSGLIDKLLPLSASYPMRRRIASPYAGISPATAVAASYRPSLAASYTPGGMKSTGLSADPMFEGISW